MVAVLCEHRKEWFAFMKRVEIFEYRKEIKFSKMTVDSDGVKTIFGLISIDH
jgi:hypothetical protein